MTKQPKVFHLICRRGLGGVQTQFELFYEKLNDEQLKHSFIIEPCARKGITGYLTLWWELLALTLACRRSRTVVHVYNGLTSVKYVLLFFFLRPVNLIHHERGNAWNLPADRDWVLRQNATLARFIICNSNATRTLLIKRFQIETAKLVVMYNGVCSFGNVKLKKIKSNCSVGLFEVGFVGRLEPHKGVHTLIDAVAMCPDNQIHLTIIGEGSQRGFLERRAKDLGINVTFAGRLDYPLKEMNDFNCVVVPSVREPFGNVIVEAGVMSKAVIASNVDGIPEIIEHNKSGILITPDEEIPEQCFGFDIPIPSVVVDPKSGDLVAPMQISARKLCNAILDLKNTPERCDELGANLYATVSKKFEINRYINELFAFYSKIVKV